MNLEKNFGSKSAKTFVVLVGLAVHLFGARLEAAPQAASAAVAADETSITGTVEVAKRNLLGHITRVRIRVSKSEAYDVIGGPASTSLLKLAGQRVTVKGKASKGAHKSQMTAVEAHVVHG